MSDLIKYRTEWVWWGKILGRNRSLWAWILNVTPNTRLKCGQQKFMLPSPSPLPKKTTRTKQSIAGRLMSRRSLLIVFFVCVFFLFLVFLCLNYTLPHRSGSFALRIMTHSFRFFSGMEMDIRLLCESGEKSPIWTLCQNLSVACSPVRCWR